MKTVTILEDQDMESIVEHLQQVDIEIGSMYNKEIPDELKANIKEINYHVQKLGKLLGAWV